MRQVSQAEQRRSSNSISLKDRALDLAELASFSDGRNVYPWDFATSMSGPELTTDYTYWGLASGTQAEKNARWLRLHKAELTWFLGLSKDAQKEALNHISVQGWKSSAQTLAMVAGLRNWRPPTAFPVVRASAKPGIPSIERRAAPNVDDLAEQLAGMQVTPIQQGIVQPETQAKHIDVANDVIDELVSYIQTRKKRYHVFCYFGLDTLTGFDADRNARFDVAIEQAVEMVASVAAAGGAIAALQDRGGSCPFHAGREGSVVYAFKAEDGSVADLTDEAKAEIWKRMDKAFHTAPVA